LLLEIAELEQKRDTGIAQSRTIVEGVPAPKPIVEAPTPFRPVFVPSSVVVAPPPAPPPPVSVPEPEPVAAPPARAPQPEPIAPPPAPAPEPIALVKASKQSTRGRFFGLRLAFNVVIGAAMLGLAVLLTPVTQLAGGTQLLAVMSGSMEPVIHVGGIVAVRPVAVSDLQVGDVITFANQGNPDVLVTHRVVSLDARGGQTVITTKGDANDTVDALTVPATRPVGRVDFTLPWLGYVMMGLASPMAKVGIVAIALIGLAIPQARRTRSAPAAQPAPPAYETLEREIESLLPRAA
jgi:signal peptidase